jgi:two-component system sensor histidine kinase BaeS
MTRSLTLKLVLAFLIVSVTGAALVAAFARWATFKEFDLLVLDQAQNNFVAEASAYYQAYGSWIGVAEYFRRPAPAPAPLPQPQPRYGDRPEPQPPPLSFTLVDQDGRVLVPAGPYRVGERVPAAKMRQGVEVEVEGQVVGTVITTGQPPALDPQEERYLARTNQALLYGALAATAIALFLGVFLARTLTHPLRELTIAIRAMAQGKLGQKVVVRSRDELGELAMAFNQMSADLARANKVRRQMTADIAHDLRTPLTVITGYIESLRDGVLKPSPARLDAMYDEAQHLQRLVEDLRMLSLADAGELPLNRQPVSPRALLERLAAAYRHQAERQNIALHVRPARRAEPDLPEIAERQINVDPERMMQMLGNLVSNALRYTPEGGQISLGATQRGDDVLLTVQDNGAGIAAEALPHIFERFYRGDPSRQQQNGESGLGLAIAKSIVEAHGGKISAQSTFGEGTTFTILLPSSHKSNKV